MNHHPQYGHVYELEGYVLDFPDGGITSSAAFADNGYDPSSTGGVGYDTDKVKSDTVKRLTTDDFMTNNEGLCDHLPDPDKADSRSMGWEYSPYFVGVEHPNWDPPARSNLDPTVFAKMPTGEYRIHDRRFFPLHRIPSMPLSLTVGGHKPSTPSIVKVTGRNSTPVEFIVHQDRNV